MNFLLLAFLLVPAEPIQLPPAPASTTSLQDALKLRQTAREFSPRALPLQTVSGLLWAAYGMNRPATGGRTAPSAHNWQTIDVYVVLENGVYLYEPKPHRLVPVAQGDHRPLAGTQDFVNTAPVNLVLAARMEKTKKSAEDSDTDILSWVSIEAGAISQNAALYCAANGLNSVLRVGVQREAFAKLVNLPSTAKIILAHTVGYPPAR
jgi:SagB-type dehydrogenase family enzyme